VTAATGLGQTNKMEIRVLQPDDAAAYWDIRLEALQSEPSAFGMAGEEFRKTTVQDTEKRLLALPAESFFLGAFDEGVLAGIATFIRDTHLKERHKGRVYGVYIAASHRGKGWGRALMNALLEKARTQRGLEQILLAVATSNATAVALYRSLGFEVYGTEPRALKIGETYVDEQYMVLMLRASERRERASNT
jgi:ribosomal protein S18 acetylase RimI-like enzyme